MSRFFTKVRKIRIGQTHVWPILVLFLSIALAYQNSLTVPFQYDDEQHMMSVQHGGYTLSNLWQFSRPIPIATLMLQNYLHGDTMHPYHVFNSGVHFLNAVLVYFLVWQLLKQRRSHSATAARLTALAVSLLFAVHPLQTQSVTYIVQRMSSLAAFFFLLGVTGFIALLQNSHRLSIPRTILYNMGVILCGVCAFLSKENAVVFPGVLLLTVILFYPSTLRLRTLKNPLIVIGGLLLLFGGIILFRQTLTAYPSSLLLTIQGEYLTRSNYGLTQLAVLPRYLGQTVLPIRQNIDHAIPVTTTFDSRVAAGTFVLFALVLLACLLYKKQPFVTFGIGWFLLTMLVESSIFPINDVYVEHRMYLPMIGLLIALVPLLLTAFTASKLKRIGAIMVVVSIAIVLIVATYKRNVVWQSSLALWTDSAAKAPNNPRAHYNLAIEYLQRQDGPKAIEEFYKSVEAYPKFHRAYNNIGAMLFQAGEYRLAATYFMKALSYDTTVELYDVNLNRAIEYLDNPEATTPPPEMARAMYH